MIIVSIHVLYVGFMNVLGLFTSDRGVCQVLQFMSVYVGWQGRGAQQQDRNITGTIQGQGKASRGLKKFGGGGWWWLRK